MIFFSGGGGGWDVGSWTGDDFLGRRGAYVGPEVVPFQVDFLVFFGRRFSFLGDEF